MRYGTWSILALGVIALGCSEPKVTGNPRRVDPNQTGPDSGGVDVIYEATQKAISDLVANPRVRQQKGNRIVLGRIVNNTSIANYDERIAYNKFLSSLTSSTDDRFVFLSRQSVTQERDLQQGGQVGSTGVAGPVSGADMVLEIEVRELRGAKTDTIQYTYQLTNLNGEIVWIFSTEAVKTNE
jgi:peptidoglycan-synthase activator LpoB